MLAPACGALLGAVMNAINGRVSADYFAIVMSWDWAAAPSRAILQGVLEGCAAGLLFAIGLLIIIAASTAMCCPAGLAVRALATALVIVAICWLIGGVSGVILARIRPRLWGSFFIGVPLRVNLVRFAWVGGSIWGAYGGMLIGLIVAGVSLHLRWRRMHAPRGAFAVITAPPPPLPPAEGV